MKSLNVSMPEALRQFIESQVGDRTSFSTPSEYVRDLIRQDQARKAREHVDALLIEGLESGPAKPVGRGWKRQVLDAARKRAGKLKRNGASKNGH